MSQSLPPAPWRAREGLAALIKALGAEHIRWVGGAVRDTLLDMAVHDIDCATVHDPATVMKLCDAAGIRTVPTGIDHGTVTAVLSDGTVEITTLRRDVATDGRRATIAFATDWRDDAARRDFTINALYAHPVTGVISDYFGGLDDLAARRVRFIGDARDRIAEDHLRILRYYRFQARFGAELDPVAEEACAAMAETLKGLSRERIADELIKLLDLPNPFVTVSRMATHGVLNVVLPETRKEDVETLGQVIAAEADQGFAPDPIRRLAALLPAQADIAEGCAARLRLSKAQRARLVSAAKRNLDDGMSAQALAYNLGVQSAQDRLLLMGFNAEAIRDYAPPVFPLKGGAIVARGVAAGPDVARILQTVERRWVDAGFPDVARLEQFLDDVLRENGA